MGDVVTKSVAWVGHSKTQQDDLNPRSPGAHWKLVGGMSYDK